MDGGIMKNSLGSRMKKNYEDRYRFKLIRRTPVIFRLDGKCFSSLTALKCSKPFDARFNNIMRETAFFLCAEIQGTKFAYTQSDEISILITDYDTLETEAWFDYNLQKMVSISASMASVFFSKSWNLSRGPLDSNDTMAFFDCRAFNLPKEEVCNYFIWRQQDWIRNSLSMLARAHFSHKELYKKNSKDIHEMLHEKGINWASLTQGLKNGSLVERTELGWLKKAAAPIFSENREVIEKYL